MMGGTFHSRTRAADRESNPGRRACAAVLQGRRPMLLPVVTAL